MTIFGYLKHSGIPDDLDVDARVICTIAERILVEGKERLEAGVLTPEQFTEAVFSGFVQQVGRKYEGRITLNCNLVGTDTITNLDVECLGDDEGLNCVVVAVLEVIIREVTEVGHIYVTNKAVFGIARTG